MSDLKPCPCCGPKGNPGVGSDRDGQQYWVMCSNCGLLTNIFRNGYEAVAAWNERVPDLVEAPSEDVLDDLLQIANAFGFTDALAWCESTLALYGKGKDGT